MKTIPNKTTSINHNDGEKVRQATYADLIRIVINSGKQGGYDYQDIENRMAISSAIKDSPEEINLEDANYNYLKKLVTDMKWNFWHEDLLGFKNSFS